MSDPTGFMHRLSQLSVQRKLSFSFGALVILIVIQGAAALYFINGVGQEGRHVGTELTPLADAAMEIKLTATTAHLKFEEIMAGDDSEDIAEVWALIASSRQFATAILEGGTLEGETFYPSRSDEVKRLIREVLALIDDFEQSAHSRFENMQISAGASPGADAEFDRLYQSLISTGESWRNQAARTGDVSIAVLAGDFRYHLSNGHLTLAEIMGGDESESLDKALTDFAAAAAISRELARKSLDGASTATTDVTRLTDLARARYSALEQSSGPGTAAEAAFDESFDAFVEKSEAAEVSIHAEIDAALSALESKSDLSLVMMLTFIATGVMLALLLAFAVIAAWMVRNVDADESSDDDEPQWRNGLDGYGLYRGEVRIDGGSADDE